MKRSSWQRGLDNALNGLVTIGDILTVFIQTVIVAFGTLAILTMLLVVEIHAVSLGIKTFEANAAFAGLAAGVLVLLNLMIKFQEVYADYIASDLRARYQPTKRYAPSLKTMLGNLAYWLGVSRNWQERELPASHNFAVTRRWITIAILVIALIGRTGDAIDKVSSDAAGGLPWSAGVEKLVTQSSLADISEWTTAIVFTFVLVIASQQLTQYVAVRVLDIRRGLRMRGDAVTVERAEGKPVLAFDTPRTMQPIKIKVGSVTKYQCPQCSKVVSRQAWSNHPCRFTTGVDAVVDGAIDGKVIQLTEDDTLDASVDRQPVKLPVNAVNRRASSSK
jgi:hypothetical protein